MLQPSDRFPENSDCIVIGGGITGLVTATILQRSRIEVTVLDKGRGIGGRLATRRITHSESIEGVFDYGTQYFSSQHPQLQPWIEDWLQQGVIKEWCRVGEADGKRRFRGVEGTRGIGKYLAQNLSVRTSTKVVKLKYDDEWLVETADRQQYRGNVLVMTPPVPQTLALLDASAIALTSDLRQSLEQIKYYPCIAVLALLEKPSQIPAPGGIALENELIWLADNHQKGISPDGYAVTLHANPKFSDAHWDCDDAEIAEKLFDAASEYFDSTVVKYQVHRWRYSLPKTFYHQPCLTLPEMSLVMAGDAFVAPKIEGAVLSGIAAGESIVG